MPYWNTNLEWEAAIKSSLPKVNPIISSSAWSENNLGISEFMKNNSANIEYNWTNYTKSTTFIKSEYSSSAWIEIKKTFKDINWELL